MTVTAINPSIAKARGGNLNLVLARLGAASAGIREAKSAVTTANEHLGLEITEARRAGVTWTDVAAAAGVSINHAMSLVKVAPDGMTVPEGSEAGGLMSVLQYAGYAGISQMTVYKWIKQGKLETTHTDRGKIRVVVPT